jgi:hypothetical protein
MLPETSFFEIFIILVILGVCSMPILVAGITVIVVVIARRNKDKEK